jgi:hypothetical protein
MTAPTTKPVADSVEAAAEVLSYRALECQAIVRVIPRQNGTMPFDVGAKLYASMPSTDQEGLVEKAAREAIVLIDEINERLSSRQFYGIGHTTHGKLSTIRATLQGALTRARQSGAGA